MVTRYLSIPVLHSRERRRTSLVVRSTSAILLVQHDPSARAFTRSTLTFMGFRVLQAPGGLEAMSVMLSYPGTIRLAIVDIVMPGVNGLDFANQLRIERPKAQILYISAFSGSVAADSIMTINPESILTMPFTADELTARVTRLFASKRVSARQVGEQ
jgi:two-component system, cell cycle sensor histidine kinase and response regulator CckA